MALAVFLQAIQESFKFKKTFPWLLMAVGCYFIANAWPRLFIGVSPVEQYSDVSSILVFRVLALASAIFTTAIVGQEVERRTIVYLLTRPVPRWILLAGRYAASVIVVVSLTSFAAMMTGLGAYHGAANPAIVGDLKAIVSGALAYGALFLLVSLIFNRAMIICLLFAFGWETSVPNLPGDLYHVSIYSYLQAIAAHPGEHENKLVEFASGKLANSSITPSAAYIALGALIVVTLLLSGWWFTHFEFVPREDAE